MDYEQLYRKLLKASYENTLGPATEEIKKSGQANPRHLDALLHPQGKPAVFANPEKCNCPPGRTMPKPTELPVFRYREGQKRKSTHRIGLYRLRRMP